MDVFESVMEALEVGFRAGWFGLPYWLGAPAFAAIGALDVLLGRTVKVR